jgi:small subunit ribosomal protein S20e
MSYVAKDEKAYDSAGAVPAPKIHKIRITLTSSNVKNLEKCAYIGPMYVLLRMRES